MFPLSETALKSSSECPDELSDAFIAAYNETAKPFVWTEAKVYQKRFKARIAHQ